MTAGGLARRSSGWRAGFSSGLRSLRCFQVQQFHVAGRLTGRQDGGLDKARFKYALPRGRGIISLLSIAAAFQFPRMHQMEHVSSLNHQCLVTSAMSCPVHLSTGVCSLA